ncbi:MAG: hypothetical protein AB7K04_16365 [Pseudorhodoplanes sp.]
MSGEAGGWLWLVLDVVAVGVLGFALAYGVMVWRRRRSGLANAVRDRATERLYTEGREPDEGDRRAAR